MSEFTYNYGGEYEIAVAEKADRWVSACGGDERPFIYDGVRWLYVYNPARHLHGWLNLDTDIVSMDHPVN